MSTREATWRPTLFGRDEPGVLAWCVAWSTIGVAAALVSFLLARRLAGALTEPLPAGPLLATAVVGLSWAFAVRMTTRSCAVHQSTIVERVLDWCPPFVLLTLAIACSYPGARLIDWLVWLPALGASWWIAPLRTAPARRRPPAEARAAPRQLARGNQQVLQQLTRIRTADGQDAVSGTLVAEFTPGERTVTQHAAFCPPFERLPHVEAKVIDASTATVKVVQVLHQGVRLDVRLATPAEEACRVSVELLAAEIYD